MDLSYRIKREMSVRRWLRWASRNRLTSETFTLSGQRFRITRQRGRVIGLEIWTPPSTPDGGYGYRVFKDWVR